MPRIYIMNLNSLDAPFFNSEHFSYLRFCSNINKDETITILTTDKTAFYLCEMKIIL